MKGTRPTQAGALAGVDRSRPAAYKKATHMERPEGGSLCLQGRNSYYQTKDAALVTCKSCRKLLEEKS